MDNAIGHRWKIGRCLGRGEDPIQVGALDPGALKMGQASPQQTAFKRHPSREPERNRDAVQGGELGSQRGDGPGRRTTARELGNEKVVGAVPTPPAASR